MILASSAVAALNFYGLGLGLKDKEQRLRWFTSPHPQESAQAQAQAQAHTKTSQWDLDSSSSVQKSISLRVGNCILALNQGDGDYLPGHSRGRPVQFLHIPKAGGTSVQKYVKEMAEPANIRVWWHDGGGMKCLQSSHAKRRVRWTPRIRILSNFGSRKSYHDSSFTRSC